MREGQNPLLLKQGDKLVVCPLKPGKAPVKKLGVVAHVQPLTIDGEPMFYVYLQDSTHRRVDSKGRIYFPNYNRPYGVVRRIK